MIIVGCSDHRVRERLLREDTLELKHAICIGQAAEQTTLEFKEFDREDREVHTIVKAQSACLKYRDRGKDFFKNCKFCAGSHECGKCPAYGKRCKSCQKLNHFSRCCRNTERVKHVECESADDSDEDFFAGTITAEGAASLGNSSDDGEGKNVYAIGVDKEKKASVDWSIYLYSNGTDVEYKIDTGAQVNILLKKIVNKLKIKPLLKPSNIKLTAYNGSSISILSKCILKVTNKATISHVYFIVADTDSPPIVGLNTSIDLGLIKRLMEINGKDVPDDLLQFCDCFGDLGKLPQMHHY